MIHQSKINPNTHHYYLSCTMQQTNQKKYELLAFLSIGHFDEELAVLCLRPLYLHPKNTKPFRTLQFHEIF